MKKEILKKSFLVFLALSICGTLEAMAQRSEIYSVDLSRSRSGFNYETTTSGFDFRGVQFRYQFVNCGGDVQMGINYENQANYTLYYHKGKSYAKSSIGDDLWPSSNDFELNEIKAELYYGNMRLGEVKLNYIVGNFAGCFGETWDVLEQVGKNPSDKEFKDDIDKLSLRNIRVLRGGPTKVSEYKIQDKIDNL